MTTLADIGIHLRHEQPGEHRAACPECTRTKHRPRDDALAVRLEPDGGATWLCHFARSAKLGDNLSPLAQVPAEFLKIYGRRLSYSMLWRLAIEGVIPVVRVSGRLFLDKADMPLVVAALEKRGRQPTAA